MTGCRDGFFHPTQYGSDATNSLEGYPMRQLDSTARVLDDHSYAHETVAVLRAAKGVRVKPETRSIANSTRHRAIAEVVAIFGRTTNLG